MVVSVSERRRLFSKHSGMLGDTNVAADQNCIPIHTVFDRFRNMQTPYAQDNCLVQLVLGAFELRLQTADTIQDRREADRLIVSGICSIALPNVRKRQLYIIVDPYVIVHGRAAPTQRNVRTRACFTPVCLEISANITGWLLMSFAEPFLVGLIGNRVVLGGGALPKSWNMGNHQSS